MAWRLQHDAQERVLPDFLIIGVMKGGTTSLFDYLAQHPCMVPPIEKETQFVFHDHDDLGLGLRAYFPLQREMEEHSERLGHRAMTGEATPENMYLPKMVERFSTAAPHAKLIALLREPVARAYSHFKHNMSRNLDPIRDFGQALAAEDARTGPLFEAFDRDPRVVPAGVNDWTYMHRARYAEQLERVFEKYPRDRVMVISSERFFAETPAVYAEVLAFLGLPPHQAKLDPKNQNQYDKIDPAIRARLADQVRPWNERLFSLLGTRYDW